MSEKLSLAQSTLLGVAGNAPAYGVGIATAAMVASSAHAAPVAVLICGAAMAGILIAYQRLNELEPNCGAAYAWVAKLVHPVAGFLAGWSLLVALEFFMVSAMLAAGQTIAGLFGLDPVSGKLVAFVLALAVLLLVTIPSLFGASVFGRFQAILTLLELSILAVIAVSAFYQNGAEVVRLLPRFLGREDAFDLNGLGNGVVIAVFFFWGWDVIFNLAEETLETRRNSAVAALYTVVLLILLYFTFTALAIALVSESDLGKPGQNVLLAIANKILPSPYGDIAVAAFLISLVGSLDASIIQFSRTLLSMSRDGVFSRRFAQVSRRSGVPTFGVLATVALAGIMTSISFFSATVNEIIAAGVTGSAVFVTVYYVLAGLACATFFFRENRVRGTRHLAYVLCPAMASIVLIACAVLAATEFSMVVLGIVSVAFIAGLVTALFQNGMFGFK